MRWSEVVNEQTSLDEGPKDEKMTGYWKNGYVDVSSLPDVLYHGTATSNINGILSKGLLIKKDRAWGGSSEKFNPENDTKALWVTDNIESAKSYAHMGGSSHIWGKGDGVVFAFKPQEGDKISPQGHPNAYTVRNTISPERLTIVYPPRFDGKLDDLKQQASDNQVRADDKTSRIKEINKKLKSLGSAIVLRGKSKATDRVAFSSSFTNTTQTFMLDDPKIQQLIDLESKSPSKDSKAVISRFQELGVWGSY